MIHKGRGKVQVFQMAQKECKADEQQAVHPVGLPTRTHPPVGSRVGKDFGKRPKKLRAGEVRRQGHGGESFGKGGRHVRSTAGRRANAFRDSGCDNHLQINLGSRYLTILDNCQDARSKGLRGRHDRLLSYRSRGRSLYPYSTSIFPVLSNFRQVTFLTEQRFAGGSLFVRCGVRHLRF